MRSARAGRELEPAALSDEVPPVPIEREPLLVLPIEPLPEEVLPDEVLPLVVELPVPELLLPIEPLLPVLPDPMLLPELEPVPEDVLPDDVEPEVVPDDVPLEPVPDEVPDGGAFVPGVVTPGAALRLVGSLGLLPPGLLVLPPVPLVEPLPLVWATASPLARARQAAATIVALCSCLLICLISWWKGNGEVGPSAWRTPAVAAGRQGLCPWPCGAGIPLAASAAWNVKST